MALKLKIMKKRLDKYGPLCVYSCIRSERFNQFKGNKYVNS